MPGYPNEYLAANNWKVNQAAKRLLLKLKVIPNPLRTYLHQLVMWALEEISLENDQDRVLGKWLLLEKVPEKQLEILDLEKEQELGENPEEVAQSLMEVLALRSLPEETFD